MAKIKMVSTTMTKEQWDLLMETSKHVADMQTEVTELQDALVEIADIVAGGDETDG